ncbi:MAG: hypothetical protein EAY75_03235 [Bacteroidetes bacterium]|nr:MAG: hypothetical protein EAY75_03235 [Bacteroidota bacterium]
MADSAELGWLAGGFFALFVCGLLVVCGIGENQNIKKSEHQKISHPTSDIEHQTSDIFPAWSPDAELCSLAGGFFALFVFEIAVGLGIGKNQKIRTSKNLTSDIRHRTSDIVHFLRWPTARSWAGWLVFFLLCLFVGYW